MTSKIASFVPAEPGWRAAHPSGIETFPIVAWAASDPHGVSVHAVVVDADAAEVMVLDDLIRERGLPIDGWTFQR